ncbi:MAG: HAD superfamily hydrolase (TIGR01490 family) [Kiritimatiellia bacterium]|jgi:HAD superfamily hydrolase (TIGR01490 family)
MSVALFDLDRTLIDVNSGHLWLRHEFNAGRVTWSDLARAVWWFARYRTGSADGLDTAFDKAVAAYNGIPHEELAEIAQRFFETSVQSRLRPGAQQALDRHRQAGDRIVLASSTTQYLAHSAAKEWDLDPGVHTKLEVIDGVLTGKIASMAIGDHKRARVVEWAQAERVDLSEAYFYTDSGTDASLMRLVGHPVAVNPDRSLDKLARELGWPIEEWGQAKT